MYAGVPARIPSPRELAAHTQSIMQGALIKKKLEEQRENFRRRQEMQLPKQPTPISFTPTSVSCTTLFINSFYHEAVSGGARYAQTFNFKARSDSWEEEVLGC